MIREQGPAELVLMATVARQHYVHRRSKVEIAEALQMSRFKVARLLDTAVEQGLVRVEIVPVQGLDLELSSRLQEALALRHSVVVTTHGSAAEQLVALGSRAAALLSEVLTAEDVLGLPLSRSVMATVQALVSMPPARVVQLSGAMDLPGVQASAVDLVRSAARLGGGEASTFYAPFVLDDAATTQALRAQSRVIEGLTAIDAVTHAVVGIGGWAPELSTIHAVATTDEHAEIRGTDVVGEIAGVLFDRAGAAVPTGLSRRLITLSAAQLAAIPEVIGVAAGARKAEAVRAAVRGGFVNALVVDHELGEALLAR